VRKWGLGAGRAIIGVLVLYWLWRSGSIDWSALRGLYEHWGLTLLALGLIFLDLVVISLRLSRLFAARRLRLTLADSTRLNLVTNLFNLFLPTGGGDVARIYYAVADAAGQRTTIAAILFFDRVIGLVALLLCPLVLMPGSMDLIRHSAVIRSLLVFCALAAAGLVALGIVLTSRRLRGTAIVSGVLARMPMRAHVESALETLRGFRERRYLLEVLAISLVAHLLSGLVVVILLVATGGPLAFHPVVFLSLIGFMANSIPLTPGGIGLGEAAFESLFALAGIAGGAATMIAWRVLLLGLAPAGLWVFLRARRMNPITITA
jgi:uncharacterized protein (TIRG00374 family)